MPLFELTLHLLIRHLEDSSGIGEVLFFPEFTTFHPEASRLPATLAEHARRIGERSELNETWMRFRDARPEVGSLSLELQPSVDPQAEAAPASVAWRDPVEVTLHFVAWSRGPGVHLAYVPALSIHVYARDVEDLPRRIRQESHLALSRRGALGALRQMVELQRCTRLELIEVPLELELETPAERQRRERERGAAEQAPLDEAGRRLDGAPLPEAYCVDDQVTRIARVLVEEAPRSVLLVGPSGVGKTAIIHELIRQRVRRGLGGRPFYQLSGSRIVAGMSGFGAWQERCEQIVNQAERDRAILVLGNLLELIEVGKSASSSDGIGAFFRPFIARGRITVIAECTAEQVARVDREVPGLPALLQTIDVAEPSTATTQEILRRAAPGNPPVADAALRVIERLHARFAPYSARPGRVLRFLAGLRVGKASRDAIEPDDVTVAFAAETGLPRLLIEDSLPLDLERTRGFFTDRVVGQDTAVDLVVDLLATVKTGLARPRRPIASLLFVGPTGVGKTELAKTLAEFMFSDRERMLRFDMSEFADPVAVQRLIGGLGTAEGQLVARVREHPFSVLLFDEFEKADPAFFDLLLQVLGEGRLTDARGRVADFCNTVVIMTSNLAAESFQRGRVGLHDRAGAVGDAGQHFGDAVQRFLRPEIVGRIDRVVPFAALGAAAIESIAHRELQAVARRDGIRHGDVELATGAGVAEYFARVGFDPLLGARPLKRAIERELVVPLAEEICRRRRGRHRLGVSVEVADGLVIQGRELQDRLASTCVDGDERSVLSGCSALRRAATMAQRCSKMRWLESEINRIERIERRAKAGHRALGPSDHRDIGRLDGLRGLRDDIRDLQRSAIELEERALIPYFLERERPPGLAHAEHELQQRLFAQVERLVEVADPDAGHITLGLFAPRVDDLRLLAGAWIDVARARDAEVEVALITLTNDPATGKRDLLLWPAPDVRSVPGSKVVPRVRVRLERDVRGDWEVCRREVTKAERERSPIGIILAIRGGLAGWRFGSVDGVYTIRDDKRSSQVLVDAVRAPTDRYQPPPDVERAKSYPGSGPELVRDTAVKYVGKSLTWPVGELHEPLGELVDSQFRILLWEELTT